MQTFDEPDSGRFVPPWPSFCDFSTPTPCFWQVASTGERAIDCARGRALAVEALACARVDREVSAVSIAMAVGAIADRGIDDVGAAFIIRISEAAAAGGMN